MQRPRARVSLWVRPAGTRLTAAFNPRSALSALGPGTASGYPLGWVVKGKNPLTDLTEFVRWSTLGSRAWSQDLPTKGAVAGAGLSRPGWKAAAGDQRNGPVCSDWWPIPRPGSSGSQRPYLSRLHWFQPFGLGTWRG